MPGIRMGAHQAIRLEQRIALRQALDADDFVEPFRTEEEKTAVSQYALIEELKKRIAEGDYIDPTHFSLEINRALFSRTPKLARLGNDISGIVANYRTESIAEAVINLLSSVKEGDKKDLPGQLAASIRQISQSAYFKPETVLNLAVQLNGVTEEGLDILAQSTFDPELAKNTIQRLTKYANEDARIIPFSQPLVRRAFNSIERKGEPISSEQALQIYTKILESLYMLDREHRHPLARKLEKSIEYYGIAKILQSPLPVPIQLAAEEVTQDLEGFIRICNDEKFRKGREIQRRIYQGLSALAEIDNNQEILNHAVSNTTDSTGLSKILSAINLGHTNPNFIYPINTGGEGEILAQLRLQLVETGLKRLNLESGILERYLERMDSDERFARLSNVATTLASYQHYQEQIGLLKEMMTAELDNRFLEWRYQHAPQQLSFLEDKLAAWKSNAKTTRLVGEQDALTAHMDAVKESHARIKEAYEEHYKTPESLTALQEKLKSIETALRGELSNRERKSTGYEASLLRDQIAYAKILDLISNLDVNTYTELVDITQTVIKNKKHPLYNHANWINETLDQPAYRQARKITITETDDLEKMLTFGEHPVPHCQNWKVDSTYNRSLASFPADPNKKLYLYSDQSGKEFAMSMVRCIEWENSPTLLIENVYSDNWSEDYGTCLVGMLADKALAIATEIGKTVKIASNNDRVVEALERFGKKYKVEIQDGHITMKAPESRNQYEYWDCGPGLIKSGSQINMQVSYVRVE